MVKKAKNTPTRYFIDRKVTVWRREFYDLAGTEEENVAFLKKECSEPEYGDEFVDSIFLDETETPIKPEDNGGETTAVAFKDGGDSYLGNEIASN